MKSPRWVAGVLGPMNRTPLRGVTIQRPSVPCASACANSSILRSKSPTDPCGVDALLLVGSKNAAHMMPKTARGNHSTPSLPWGR